MFKREWVLIRLRLGIGGMNTPYEYKLPAKLDGDNAYIVN